MVGAHQQVAIHATPYQRLGEEALGEKIDRRRETASSELKISIGIIYLGHHHPHIGVGAHISYHAGDDILFPPCVGIQHQVSLGPRLHRLPDSHIMAGSIPTIFDMSIRDPVGSLISASRLSDAICDLIHHVTQREIATIIDDI